LPVADDIPCQAPKDPKDADWRSINQLEKADRATFSGIECLREGMRRVVSRGTAALAFSPMAAERRRHLLAKTGTARPADAPHLNGETLNHSWVVVSTGEGEDALTLAVVVPYSGTGGTVAAPLARRIIQRVIDRESASSQQLY